MAYGNGGTRQDCKVYAYPFPWFLWLRANYWRFWGLWLTAAELLVAAGAWLFWKTEPHPGSRAFHVFLEAVLGYWFARYALTWRNVPWRICLGRNALTLVYGGGRTETIDGGDLIAISQKFWLVGFAREIATVSFKAQGRSTKRVFRIVCIIRDYDELISSVKRLIPKSVQVEMVNNAPQPHRALQRFILFVEGFFIILPGLVGQHVRDTVRSLNLDGGPDGVLGVLWITWTLLAAICMWLATGVRIIDAQAAKEEAAEARPKGTGLILASCTISGQSALQLFFDLSLGVRALVTAIAAGMYFWATLSLVFPRKRGV